MITIRNAAERDLQKLALIEKEFSDNCWTESQFAEELKQSHAYLVVCERDEVIIGFCDTHIVADDAHINEICIEPTHRRNGAAHALMHHVIGLCTQLGCSVLSLEVRSKNEPAIKLYEKCNFSAVGTRKGFYHDPADDAIIMNLYFKEAKV